ncbi:MAG TPA: hypothetical protein H9717_05675 [Candidatus Eisenbergiella merdipullorum]|uniref:Uncharacterized protein n=1 Tax=Candidatus Eisenbergiella merdipullorum TaxID=2838553 RepID=A0A9D2I673_9FIRM|nr:hypothetical protein [Candidatus Eisenbergiella merdipullorum]
MSIGAGISQDWLDELGMDIPATIGDAEAEACMKYLNWMADPEVAMNIYYTPDHTTKPVW